VNRPYTAELEEMMRMGRLIAVCVALLSFYRVAGAQSLRLDFGPNYANFQLNGRTLTGHEHFSNESLDEDFDYSVDISAVNLDDVLSSPTPPAYFVFSCKGGSNCVSVSSHTCSYKDPDFPRGNCPSQFTSQSTNALVGCKDESAYQGCENFLKALRAALTSSGNPPPRASGAPAPASSPAPTSKAAVQPQTGGTNELDDLLAGMGWMTSGNGTGAGKSPLDTLVNSIKPGKSTGTTPPPKNPTYAAFSQAGGFDANGAWGVGTSGDLNSAMGTAHTTCLQGAASVCEDEGYCLLRPGLWGAWASDLTVAGASAFTCNQATEGDARAQAQVWCGANCKVLWSGVGK
jgi:hypothetical protein